MEHPDITVPAPRTLDSSTTATVAQEIAVNSPAEDLPEWVDFLESLGVRPGRGVKITDTLKLVWEKGHILELERRLGLYRSDPDCLDTEGFGWAADAIATERQGVDRCLQELAQATIITVGDLVYWRQAFFDLSFALHSLVTRLRTHSDLAVTNGEQPMSEEEVGDEEISGEESPGSPESSEQSPTPFGLAFRAATEALANTYIALIPLIEALKPFEEQGWVPSFDLNPQGELFPSKESLSIRDRISFGSAARPPESPPATESVEPPAKNRRLLTTSTRDVSNDRRYECQRLHSLINAARDCLVVVRQSAHVLINMASELHAYGWRVYRFTNEVDSVTMITKRIQDRAQKTNEYYKQLCGALDSDEKAWATLADKVERMLFCECEAYIWYSSEVDGLLVKVPENISEKATLLNRECVRIKAQILSALNALSRLGWQDQYVRAFQQAVTIRDPTTNQPVSEWNRFDLIRHVRSPDEEDLTT